MKKRLTTILLSVSVLMLMAFVSKNQEKNDSSIGSYSISLNVQDISKSKVFYDKLGFSPVEEMGSVEEKWIILSNGETKIGLFQGMFPSNTITFNPKDGRSIYKKLKKEGIQPVFETNMDKSEGPCTFSIMDPDGNPILIDQH